MSMVGTCGPWRTFRPCGDISRTIAASTTLAMLQRSRAAPGTSHAAVASIATPLSLQCGRDVAPMVLRAQAGFPSRPIRMSSGIAGRRRRHLRPADPRQDQAQRDIKLIVRTAPAATRPSASSGAAASRTATPYCSCLDPQCREPGAEERAPQPVDRFSHRADRPDAAVQIIANSPPKRTVAENRRRCQGPVQEVAVRDCRMARRAISQPWRPTSTPGQPSQIISRRGTAPAANDVVGGHVPMMIEAILSLLQLVRGGSVRAARSPAERFIAGPRRSDHDGVALPGLDFRRLVGRWWRLGMPAELADKINGWVNETVNGPRRRMPALGLVIKP